MNEHPHGALHNPEVAHETSDISIRGVVWFVIVLVITAVAIDVTMWGFFVVLDKIEVRNDPYVSPLDVQPGQLPPQPRLETTPWQDLKQFVGSEQDYLNSYGWVDQGTGEVHIPIERAKELLLQRGIPARAAQNGAPVDEKEGTHFASMGEATGGRNLPAGGPDRSSPVAPGVSIAAAPGAGGANQTAPAGGQKTTPKGPGGGQ